MRTETRTVRIGEYLGPVEWESYDFQERGGDRWEQQRDRLRQVQDGLNAGQKVLVSNYGGVPRLWRPALRVGMYDGWPYWSPIPAVLTRTPLGVEWVFFMNLTGVLVKGSADGE